MSIFDLILLFIGGLWVFSRFCVTEQMRGYWELIDDIELHYADGSDASHGGASSTSELR